MQEKNKIKVGILRGGIGNQHAFSVRKGGEIISHIFENLGDKYKVVDIFVDKNGNWHANGLPITPADLVRKVDVVWNTSEHPGLSVILDDFFIPNIGNGHFLRILENNRNMLQAHMKSIGIRMPRSIVLPVYQKDFDGAENKYAIKKAKEVFEKFPAPWVVKSFTPDANMGIHLAKTFGELVKGIEDGVKHQKSILVEEFIAGKPSTVHSISGFRGDLSAQMENIYVFPIMDSIFSSTEKEKIINFAKNLHKHLAIEHYLKSDFVLHPKKSFFLTDINFSLDLRKGSHFEQSCQYVGSEMHHVVEHIIEKALKK